MRIAAGECHALAGRTLHPGVDFFQPLAAWRRSCSACCCACCCCIYRFFADLFVLVIQLPQMNWHDLVTNVLNLVDLALTANLILIVIFSSYENFIRTHRSRRTSGLARRPDPGRFQRAQAEAARLDRRHRRGRRAGLVFRSGKRARYGEADLGAGVSAHLRRLHADPGYLRPAWPPQRQALRLSGQADPNCRICAPHRDIFPSLSIRLGIINLNRR